MFYICLTDVENSLKMI